MAATIMPDREFARNFRAAKQAATNDPVFIQVEDKPAYVLLSIGNYERILRGEVTLFEAFSTRRMDHAAADHNFPGLDDELGRPADLS